MIIAHNINATKAMNSANEKSIKVSSSSEKLSSGLRINKAGDDAAGLSISEKMKSQIRGLDQASRNAQDAVSLVQTAEGAMQELNGSLQRIRELWVQRENDTNIKEDRDNIDLEVIQLLEGMDKISETTSFNEKKLIDGSLFDNKFQIGADSQQQMSLTIDPLDNITLGLPTTMFGPITVPFNPIVDISTINGALKTVSGERSKLGAVQNALEHAMTNLNNASENVQAAESRIRDVDMAKEMMSFSKNGILMQASQSMLMQANQTPQKILELLK
ncbi:flagellin [Clostridium sp. CF012]|uniref:flagellin N-terminal helical domain-containing protein n=1 Tax=Clostridium sp. CF012 TaxID=2843319 RepID=UPI001C0BB69D|nr:flagellin [Clostridium sp. CF012]MBU3142340.1 flagellin [Clostridium sp. CF012]